MAQALRACAMPFVVVATLGAADVRRMVGIARTHNEEEARRLRRESPGEVFLGTHELARGMAAHRLSRFKTPGARGWPRTGMRLIAAAGSRP